MKMRNLLVPAIGICLSWSVAANAQTVVTFDDIPEGTVASNQYTGMTITGGSVLTLDSILNPIFPPYSDPNVLYNYLNGSIVVDFTTSVNSIGGYVTGNEAVTLSAFNGAVLLGSVSTAGANYVGAGTPNEFLQLLFGDITSAVFSTSSGNLNTFTLDNLTVGGIIVTNAVPEPGTWAMMLLGFGAIGYGMRRRRRPGVALPQIA